MQLSAFVDGELPANEAEMLMRRMGQDAELRKEVAEYLAIGRLIRAEAGIAGADRLYERIAAEIGNEHSDTATASADLVAASSVSRAIRPLAGFAIAATVALIAIFSLQQAGDDRAPGSVPAAVASNQSATAVPSMDAQLEKQRVLFRKHAETSSQFGTTGLISQVVTLKFSEDLAEDTERDDTDGQESNDITPDPKNLTQP